jgi:HEAT repeat protein
LTLASRREPIVLLLALIFLSCGLLQAAEEAPDPELVQMVVDLVKDSDRDMHALGLQQVREEMPGEAVTKQFAELLPELPADRQAGLLEALGERGDTSARSAVMELLNSDAEAVRTAAIKAVGGLGNPSDVPVLAQKAAAGSPSERVAAQQSLVGLAGEGVNAAIISTMTDAEPAVRVELLGVLAARNAQEGLPTVRNSVEDSDSAVRLAALEAMRFLADESRIEEIVGIVKAAKDDQDRAKAELALLTVCSRGRQKCVDAIVSGLGDADAPSRVVLVRGLARAGGPTAMEAIVDRLNDRDEAVRDEAVRLLSIWPDSAAANQLKDLAVGDNLRYHVLAIRGLVRLASPSGDQPGDAKMLAETMNLAMRPAEKRLVLGALSGMASEESLAQVLPALDNPDLADEAGFAAVIIAEQLQDGNKDALRAAMEKVRENAKDDQIRQRAEKVLQSL